jgi:hypothetical protein
MARKRKPGPRTKSGRLKRRPHRDLTLRDLGTPEFREKRHAMINGADPQLAATASGILLANDFLTPDQHHAALKYARWHSLLYGSPWAACACPLSRELAHHGHEPQEAIVIRAKHAIDAMNARLNPEQRQAVANVAVFGFVPCGSTLPAASAAPSSKTRASGRRCSLASTRSRVLRASEGRRKVLRNFGELCHRLYGAIW